MSQTMPPEKYAQNPVLSARWFLRQAHLFTGGTIYGPNGLLKRGGQTRQALGETEQVLFARTIDESAR